MGFIDMFSKVVVCPECRKKGAKKVFGKVKCANPQCPKYDPHLIQTMEVTTSGRPALKKLSGNFDPGTNRIAIQYRNYLGEDKVYYGDKTTLWSNGEHVSIRIVPTGRRVAFRKKFIRNTKEIDNNIDELNVPVKEEPVTIKYRNFEGVNMTIVGDANTIKSDGKRIIIKAGPSHKPFYLKKDNIANLSELDKYLNR